MKFFSTTAVILAFSGFLHAQQSSTNTIIILPTPEAETRSVESLPPAAVKPAEPKPASALTPAEPSAGRTDKPAVQPAEKKSGPVQPSPLVAEGASGGFMVGKKHVVAKGDTLWVLSRKYYGDPFKWGRIYNANIGVIKTPDLIYPADELVMPDLTEEIKPEPAQPLAAEEGMNPETITELPERDAEVVSAAVPAPAAVPALGIKATGKAQKEYLGEQLEDFDATDLSEEMPQDLKEWQTNVKIVPDNWIEDGVITAKESVDGSDYSLAVSGEIVLVKAADPAAFKPDDIVAAYLKGAAAFDRKGKRLGREIQKTGMLQVISVSGDMVKARIIDASTSINKGQVVKK